MPDLALLLPGDLGAAARLHAEDPSGRAVKAGGVDLLDLMKEGLSAPAELLDIRRLPGLGGIVLEEDALEIGALVSLAELAAHPAVRGEWPLLARAAAAIATPQIRNQATVGGNLAQRSRCWYFRARRFECLRRGGSFCSAEEGDNRYHAILGGGPCHHVHPSTLGTALSALDAEVVIRDVRGRRHLPVGELFVLPADDPTVEIALAPGELIESIRLPRRGPAWRQAYMKIAEKDSHDWPLAEVAVALEVETRAVRSARVVLGHAAPIPWRAAESESLLIERGAGPASRRAAAELAVAGARPMAGNGYKPALFREAVRRALDTAIAAGPGEAS